MTSPLFKSVLCALDGVPLDTRVLRHAVGFAAVCGAQLTVVRVVSREPRRAEADVETLIRTVLPAGASYLQPPRIRVLHLSMGQPADAIVDFARDGTDLIVMGTQSKSGWARWLLGSTSAAIMEQAPCALLVVPQGQLEVVSLGPDAAQLATGTVLAAIDLREARQPQVALAAGLAQLAKQPLTLMTVAGAGVTEADAEARLRELVPSASLASPVRTLVRRGVVPDEIERAAVAEHAGLVVMGIRAPEIGTPGAIASAVLAAKDAVVLAVPSVPVRS
jgi:nucleotide-binding universal stress UspA family protein